MDFKCEFCSETVPGAANQCPHCWQPGLFPNVRQAMNPLEQTSLDARYTESVSMATSRGFSQAVELLQDILSRTTVVVSMKALNFLHFISSNRSLYSNFYKLTQAGCRIPEDDEWSMLRDPADGLLFPGYKDNIRFGLFSVDGRGLSHFGNVFLSLSDKMIMHRTSAFHEDSLRFIKRRDISVSDGIPHGYRSTWVDRVKLGVAKIASDITVDVDVDRLKELISQDGNHPDNIQFIEAHIWGGFTFRSLRSVALADDLTDLEAELIKQHLTVNGISIEEQ